MDFPLWAWAGFGVFILLMLALDLGVLNRKAHAVTYREATVWSVVWVTLALIFAGLVFWKTDRQTGFEFLTGYVIELSLSVDNLFVFLLIFSYFKVPAKYQHRVLFWGVLGALVMRMTMIAHRRDPRRALPLDHLHLRRVPHLHRLQDAAAGRGARQPGGQSGRPLRHEAHPHHAPLRGREVLYGRQRQEDGDAAAARPRHRRGHRPRLRRRLHPGHLRHHDQPVHRLHVERLRHPRPALALLPARRAWSRSSTT